ncbi:MAG TPA: RecX family transcriptional regulator [Terriglobia bacterium]|nr:RecX family transcriptional regulator [Terriglobia bacterium]
MGENKTTARTPFSAALAKLARRPYSVAELKRALEKKFPAHPAIPDALARLRQLGYLDDKKVAEQVAYSLARNRALGPHRLRRELKSKLVDYKHIEPAIEAAYEGTNPRQVLEQVLERKLRSLKLPLTRPKVASLCQSLIRRGFSSGDIIKAVRARPELRPVAENVEELDLNT